jgi:hypothetical protein
MGNKHATGVCNVCPMHVLSTEHNKLIVALSNSLLLFSFCGHGMDGQWKDIWMSILGIRFVCGLDIKNVIFTCISHRGNKCLHKGSLGQWWSE